MGQTFSMSKRLLICPLVFSLLGFMGGWSSGQEPAKATATDASSNVERGISLAVKGRCKEALTFLAKVGAQVRKKELKYDAEMSTARCAMSLGRTDTAVKALLELNRDFSDDPEVLFTTTHFYSELAARASQQLAATAPTSPQAEQLEAEAFEAQGNWDKATAEYRRILDQNPRQRGIHYRLGRIFLAESPPDAESAKKEFEEELKVDPNHAAAEFLLGETARQAGQWDEAIGHFSRASKLDEGFQESYLALGMSLNSAGKFADAIAPLESYVKMQPGDPAGHYQLASSYARTGRKREAEREMALQREAVAKSPRGTQAPQP